MKKRKEIRLRRGNRRVVYFLLLIFNVTFNDKLIQNERLVKEQEVTRLQLKLSGYTEETITLRRNKKIRGEVVLFCKISWNPGKSKMVDTRGFEMIDLSIGFHIS